MDNEITRLDRLLRFADKVRWLLENDKELYKMSSAEIDAYLEVSEMEDAYNDKL